MGTNLYGLINWILKTWKRVIRRSVAAHPTLAVSDLTAALEFYARLGFRSAATTRGREVTLLKARFGGELNLVVGQDIKSGNAHFFIDDIDREFSQLLTQFPNLAIKQSSTGRQLHLLDPDSNTIVLEQQQDRKKSPPRQLVYVGPRQLVADALSDHYFMPSLEAGRFLYAPPDSAFFTLLCQQLTVGAPLELVVVLLDKSQVSMSALVDDSELKSGTQNERLSVYPDVHLPIPRSAIVGSGVPDYLPEADEYLWPKSIGPINALTTA
ncbi:MAG: VOC family protein [Pseudomonadota bacterium]